MTVMGKGRSSSRYDVWRDAPARRPPRPERKRWRSRDLKGPLPTRVTRNLLAAIRSLPVRGPWPEIDEEAWWKDVLMDRRLRPPSALRLPAKSEDARLRLDRMPCKSLTFTCAHCRQTATFPVAELMRTFGADRNVRTVGRQAIKCKTTALMRERACPISYRA